MQTQHPVIDVRANDKLRVAVHSYLEREISSLEVTHDPRVEGTTALKVIAQGLDEPVFFLVSDWDGARDLDPACDLEEVEFKSWPPTTGKLKFFL